MFSKKPSRLNFGELEGSVTVLQVRCFTFSFVTKRTNEKPVEVSEVTVILYN